MENNKPKGLISAEEESRISRSVVVWINKFEELTVPIVNFERLLPDEESMAISTIQGTYITKRFILGGHQAEYNFKVIYRIRPANSNDKRLLADELLNNLGDWAVANPPEIGEKINVIKVETTARASLFAAYDDGTEDHQIMIKLTYEVI